MHDSSEAWFTLHDDVGDAHLTAQGGEEDDELEGIDVVRHDDDHGFLGFNEGDDVDQAAIDEERLFGVLFISEVKSVIERDDETREGNEQTLASFSSAADAAVAVERAFFSCIDSGRCLFNSLHNFVVVFLSKVCENWAMAGGTLRHWCRMTFCL